MCRHKSQRYTSLWRACGGQAERGPYEGKGKRQSEDWPLHKRGAARPATPSGVKKADLRRRAYKSPPRRGRKARATKANPRPTRKTLRQARSRPACGAPGQCKDWPLHKQGNDPPRPIAMLMVKRRAVQRQDRDQSKKRPPQKAAATGRRSRSKCSRSCLGRKGSAVRQQQHSRDSVCPRFARRSYHRSGRRTWPSALDL